MSVCSLARHFYTRRFVMTLEHRRGTFFKKPHWALTHGFQRRNEQQFVREEKIQLTIQPRIQSADGQSQLDPRSSEPKPVTFPLPQTLVINYQDPGSPDCLKLWTVFPSSLRLAGCSSRAIADLLMEHTLVHLPEDFFFSV